MKEEHHLLLLSFLVLAIPSFVFLQNSRGIGWDNIGHSAEAEIYKDMLPDIYGWNSYFLFGYPIHAYPPLSRIVLAGLMHVFDWKTATNLFIVACVLAIIPSFYLFLKSFGRDASEAAFACLVVSLYMASLYGNENSSFIASSAFKTGLVSSFFAVPFFMLSLAFFRKNLTLSGIFAAFVVLSNLIVSVLLAVCLAAFAFQDFVGKKRIEFLARYFAFGLVVFGISAFWLLPYLVERIFDPKLSHTHAIGMKYWNLLPALEGIAFCGGLYYLLFIKKKPIFGWKEFIAVAFAVAFLKCMFIASDKTTAFGNIMLESYIYNSLAVIVLASLSFAYLAKKEKGWFLRFYLSFMLIAFVAHLLLYSLAGIFPLARMLGAHFYRVNALLELLDFALIGISGWSIIRSAENLRRIAPYALVGLFAANTIFFPQNNLQAYFHPPEKHLEYDFSWANATGRAVLYDGRMISNPHGSYFQFYLQKRTPIAQGLFIENAQMAPFAIAYASYITRADTLVWGATKFPYMSGFSSDYKNASLFYSDLFWVTDLFVNHDMYKSQLDGTSEILDKTFLLIGDFKANQNTTFRHYKIGNYSLVDVRLAKPKCTTQWKKHAYEWFENNGREIYYDSCEEVQYDLEDAVSSKVRVINYSNGKIEFEVASDSAVPVFIKEAYDPGWKAYGENGEALKIYRATPLFMMVFANGKVKMEYSQYEAWLSIIMAVAALFASKKIFQGQ